MSFSEEFKLSLSKFGTMDLIVGVVMGVIVRVVMIVGSPVINVLFHGMGPIGDLGNALTLLPLIYALMLLPGALRRNGLVPIVAAETMSIIRVVTGDPFGFIAVQAYLAAGFFAWVTLTMFHHSLGWIQWYINSFVWTFWVDLIFGFYFGVFPFLGDIVLGWVWYIIVCRLVTALPCTILVILLTKALLRVEALRPVVVHPPEEKTE